MAAVEVTCIGDLTILTECKVTLLAYLQEHRLLPVKKLCHKCNIPCEILYKTDSRFIFRCKCKFEYSLNNNTWFSQARLSYVKALQVIFCFVNSVTITSALALISVSKQTLVDWYNFCREICIESNLSVEVNCIGGENRIVEIDESKFGKRKYHRGKRVEGQWVLG